MQLEVGFGMCRCGQVVPHMGCLTLGVRRVALELWQSSDMAATSLECHLHANLMA